MACAVADRPQGEKGAAEQQDACAAEALAKTALDILRDLHRRRHHHYPSRRYHHRHHRRRRHREINETDTFSWEYCDYDA